MTSRRALARITDRDMRALVAQALADGWQPVVKKRHLVLRHPDGRTTCVPGSPSDPRSLANLRADLKRGTP